MKCGAVKQLIVCLLSLWLFVSLGSEAGTHLGLPSVPFVDAEDIPAKAELGRMLFFDQRLSANGRVSCVSCHVPEFAFTDGRARSRGINDSVEGTRNAPSLLNLAWQGSFFWDGRVPTLESQVLEPLFSPVEHGLSGSEDLLKRIRQYKSYEDGFSAAFSVLPHQISQHHVASALATYLRGLVSADSRADRYMYGADSSALTRTEIEGLNLFVGRAGCATCHKVDTEAALYTDNQFHALPVSFAQFPNKLPIVIERISNASEVELAMMIQTDPEVAALGRFAVTKVPAHIGAFRTPSLRNVAVTAPYMHDGSIGSLESAVEQEIYYRGLVDGRPLILTLEEKLALVDFLKALTGFVPDNNYQNHAN